MKMLLNSTNIINLNSCLNFKHDSNSTLKTLINSLIKNVDEIEIVDPENLNDVEFLKLLVLFEFIHDHKINVEIDVEFVVAELHKRFNNNINDLIKLYLDYFIEFDDDEFDDDEIDDEIKIKNIYINNTLLFYEFVDEFNYENRYYENFYDELIDYIYIYDHDENDDELIDDIDEIFEIPENLKYYVNYVNIIDDLIIDCYYYEITYNNNDYLIHNSYY